VVEAKVLRGKFGAADMYVPGLDLIVQVDGEHHGDADQLKKDGRFNDAAVAQQRHVLRLWYA
jgi:very-short-patch-repair endonuclease